MKKWWIWIIVALMLVGVGAIPLSIVSYSEKRMELYFENASATAPLTIKIIGGIGPEKATTSGGWYTGLKGVNLRYRRLHIKVWLEIGSHFNYSDWIPQSNIIVTGHTVSWSKDLSYTWQGSVTIDVPASKIVPFMVQEINETTGEILEPQKGTLPYDIRYQASIDDVLTKKSGSWTGTCYIQIVGSVEDYLPEAPLPENEPIPSDNIGQEGWVDTEVKDEDAGSKIYTSGNVVGFEFSVPLLLIVVVVAVWYLTKKRG